VRYQDRGIQVVDSIVVLLPIGSRFNLIEWFASDIHARYWQYAAH
jgi:hypothetical protein